MSKATIAIKKNTHKITGTYMHLKPNKYLSVIILPLMATVTIVSARDKPVLYVAQDKGGFIQADDVNLLMSDDVNLVVATHGWVEVRQWPKDLALDIKNKVDSNEWAACWFDWRDNAWVINPKNAARYARGKAGAILAEQILKVSKNPRHVHLIGHSAGCWAISEAAKIIVEKTKANIHLTFLDAYVPAGWDANSLGDISAEPNIVCWADHYLTRDITRGVTYCILAHAHNVDISKITPGLADHRFPFYWYPATVIGRYDPEGKYSGDKLFCKSGNVEYGFARSLEAGGLNWQTSLKLPVGNIPVKLIKPKEVFDSSR